MKKSRRILATLLSALVATSAFAAVPFTASAATSTVTLKSNVTADKTTKISSVGDTVTVTFKLQADQGILNNEAALSYDSSVLKLASTTTSSSFQPVFSKGGSTIFNKSIAGKVYFNSSNLNTYSFKTAATYLTATFEVVKVANAEVSLNVDVLTGSSNNAQTSYVYYQDVAKSGFAFTSTVSTTPKQQGGDVVTPSDGYTVVASGDNGFNLKMSKSAANYVSGTIALQPGTYSIKVSDDSKIYAYKKTVNDYSVGSLTMSTSYSTPVTLNATGGTYTFRWDVQKKLLLITYDKKLPTHYLTGDLHTILSDVPGNSKMAVGSTYLEKGTYKFKVSANKTDYGYSKVVNDSTTGTLSFKTTYSSSVTLNATGGTYTFSYNKSTNGLIISSAISGNEASDDVHISGSGNLNGLVLTSKDDVVYTGSVKLTEGSYSMKVYNYGAAYTFGGKLVIPNATPKKLSSSYISALTVIVGAGDDGTYNVSFNVNTGELVFTKA